MDYAQIAAAFRMFGVGGKEFVIPGVRDAAGEVGAHGGTRFSRQNGMKNTKGSACPMERGEEEILLRYCAGTLAAEGVGPLDEHVESCPRCWPWVREQRAVWQALESWKVGAGDGGV
jgi:hypothetical protein